MCRHGDFSPEISYKYRVRRFVHPANVPDTCAACNLLLTGPDKDIGNGFVNDFGFFTKQLMTTLISAAIFCSEFSHTGF